MTELDGLKRYIEAATTLTQITRGRAEELVREMVASGEVERVHAQEWVEDLLKRSREASENLIAQVTAEVDKQIKNLDLDDLAVRVAGLIDLAGAVGRSVASPAARRGESTNGQTKTNGTVKAASTASTASTAKVTKAIKDTETKSKPKSSKSKPKSAKSDKKKDSAKASKADGTKANNKGPKKSGEKKSTSGESDFSSGSDN